MFMASAGIPSAKRARRTETSMRHYISAKYVIALSAVIYCVVYLYGDNAGFSVSSPGALLSRVSRALAAWALSIVIPAAIVPLTLRWWRSWALAAEGTVVASLSNIILLAAGTWIYIIAVHFVIFSVLLWI